MLRLTGMFEQDDVENWVSLTSTAAGAMARRLLLNTRMGMLADGREVVPPLAAGAFHGPGVAHVGYGEYNQRELLRRWADCIEQPPAPQSRPDGPALSTVGRPA